MEQLILQVLLEFVESFNLDLLKQAVQVILPAKKVKPNHPPIYFNGKAVVAKTEQKRLGFILEEPLNFDSL